MATASIDSLMRRAWSIQLVDAGGETTRRREPRGVSGTLEVSPTGSIPRREKPAGKSPMTRSKPLGPSFTSGTKHQREYGHRHASPDHRVETSSDQNKISQTKVHGTRGRRRRWHDRFHSNSRATGTRKPGRCGSADNSSRMVKSLGTLSVRCTVMVCR